MKVRRFTKVDLPALTRLSALAGWNQTEDDWTRLLRLEPHGCLCMEADGQLVASCTLLCYGTELGWLGMVLTDPAYRRRGLARQLVQSALDYGKEVGLRSIKLDASDEGFSLYESLGFRTEQIIQRWAGRPCPLPSLDEDGLLHPVRQGAPSLALDRRAFGADRSALLRDLAKHDSTLTNANGFVLVRPGAHAMYLGPCVAETPSSARQLLQHCFIKWSGSEWFWDLLPSNDEALKLANSFGLQPVRRLTRMISGGALRPLDSLVYAAGGFEIG
jgi:GNAT superfamily N-acetyltransferase